MGLIAPIVRTTESARRLGTAFRRHRTIILGAAALRAIFGIAAVPLVPLLYREHFVWVVFLRPTKEILLVAGFLIRKGDVGLLPAFLASLPLTVGGVWLMYLLGVVYRSEIRKADLPGPAGTLLPPARIKKLSQVLRRAGARVVFLGRLAIFPSTLMAAAAGASELPPRRFGLADSAGAVLSIVQVLVAGYLLGEAYESAGPWFTVAGAAALLLVLFLVGRRLIRNP